MPKVLNRRNGHPLCGHHDRIYVGRPSKWGNPYRVGVDGDHFEVRQKYAIYLLENPLLMSQLEELRGHDLVCWCAPLPCHADVLLRLSNAL